MLTAPAYAIMEPSSFRSVTDSSVGPDPGATFAMAVASKVGGENEPRRSMGLQAEDRNDSAPMASLRAPIFVKTALPTQSSEEFLLRDL